MRVLDEIERLFSFVRCACHLLFLHDPVLGVHDGGPHRPDEARVELRSFWSPGRNETRKRCWNCYGERTRAATIIGQGRKARNSGSGDELCFVRGVWQVRNWKPESQKDSPSPWKRLEARHLRRCCSWEEGEFVNLSSRIGRKSLSGERESFRPGIYRICDPFFTLERTRVRRGLVDPPLSGLSRADSGGSLRNDVA